MKNTLFLSPFIGDILCLCSNHVGGANLILKRDWSVLSSENRTISSSVKVTIALFKLTL